MNKLSNAFGKEIVEIDQEHELLLEEIKRVLMGDGIAKYSSASAIKGILDKVRMHFNHEERLMNAAHYPDMTAHVERHRVFIRELEFLAFHDTCSWDELRGNLLFLRNWMIGHINTQDKMFVDFLCYK